MTNISQILKGSWSLYKWKLEEKDIDESLNIIKDIKWYYFLISIMIITLLISVIGYFQVSLNLAQAEIANTLGSFGNVMIEQTIGIIMGVIVYFIGFYTTKLFFNTNLTIFDFIKFHTYVVIPGILLYFGAQLVTFLLLLVSPILALVGGILSLISFYFILQGLSSLLFIMSKKFNTNQWNLAFFVLAFYIIWGLFLFFIINTIM